MHNIKYKKYTLFWKRNELWELFHDMALSIKRSDAFYVNVLCLSIIPITTTVTSNPTSHRIPLNIVNILLKSTNAIKFQHFQYQYNHLKSDLGEYTVCVITIFYHSVILVRFRYDTYNNCCIGTIKLFASIAELL